MKLTAVFCVVILFITGSAFAQQMPNVQDGQVAGAGAALIK
jgi:hypothetical protein